MGLRHLISTSLLVFGLLVQPAIVCAESPTSAAEGVLQRLMPQLARQFDLALVSRPDDKDYFRITGTRGHIRVEAATQPTLLYGVNWYLKYVAHLQVSTNGVQLGSPGLILRPQRRPLRSLRFIVGAMH